MAKPKHREFRFGVSDEFGDRWDRMKENCGIEDDREMFREMCRIFEGAVELRMDGYLIGGLKGRKFVVFADFLPGNAQAWP